MWTWSGDWSAGRARKPWLRKDVAPMAKTIAEHDAALAEQVAEIAGRYDFNLPAPLVADLVRFVTAQRAQAIEAHARSPVFPGREGGERG